MRGRKLVSLTVVLSLNRRSYLLAMNLHVLFEVRARAEALNANFAHKGLLARVDPLVSYQV